MIETKYFCDFCKKEIKEEEKWGSFSLSVRETTHKNTIKDLRIISGMLCISCCKKFFIKDFHNYHLS